MSIQAMSWAMEQQLCMDPSACSVLQALGNHADRDGTGAFPSVETLRRYTKLSERTIQAKLALLEKTGMIRRGNQDIAAAHIARADRRPVVWDLAMERGVQPSHPVEDADEVQRSHPENENGVQSSHPENGTGCNSRGNGVQILRERGAAAAPEPSLNHPGTSERDTARVAGGAEGDHGVGTEAGRACLLMRSAGCSHTNPSHPDLLAALAEGVTPEVLRDTSAEAVEAGVGKPFAWAITTARNRHARGASAVVTTTGVSHEANRRLSAVERVQANIERNRLQRGDLIEGEATRVAG